VTASATITTRDTRGRIPIRAAKILRGLLRSHFLDLDAAANDPERRVAWLSSVGPVELVRAMGYEVYFPENHGALLGATRTASGLIPHALSRGYSPDICSYLTSDIGSHIAGRTPLQDLYGIPHPPRPDLLVYNTNQCRDVADWWGFYAREFDVPVVGVHPPHQPDIITSHHLDVVRAEHAALVDQLEAQTGRRMDRERLKETVERSRQAAVLWRDVLNLARHRPSPLTFFDGAIHMAPIVVLRGTQEAVDYYQILKTELEERVLDGVAAVPGERLRLYWEGMPVWGALREISSLFFEHQVAVVASTYCNSWVFDKLDPENIEESLARVYTEIFINRSERAKAAMLQQFASDFSIDGMVFHDCKTCPNNSNCRYGMPERLHESCGLASVVIDGDMTDLRLFSLEQTRTVLEGFVEQLSDLSR
jgi:benzoyl-CoA reductase/2-hydroxyglutaryl-CoA dehydratase subunit BcrC/BadD/HgdB